MAAILKFEADRRRINKQIGSTIFRGSHNEKPMDRVFNIAMTAACDTISHGGTFVLVVTPDKITMIQRTEVEDIEAEEKKR